MHPTRQNGKFLHILFYKGAAHLYALNEWIHNNWKFSLTVTYKLITVMRDFSLVCVSKCVWIIIYLISFKAATAWNQEGNLEKKNTAFTTITKVNFCEPDDESRVQCTHTQLAPLSFCHTNALNVGCRWV